MSEEEEYEYDYGSDDSYNYGSDIGNDDNDMNVSDDLIEIENAFYEGDDEKIENPLRAIEKFESVVRLETSRGQEVKWRFKALRNLVLLHHQMKMYKQMLIRYREVLSYIHAVTKNECTDTINSILDTIAEDTDVTILSEIYEITLAVLKNTNNERLWYSTNLKLAKVYLELRKITEVKSILKSLADCCRNPDGSDDITKANILLEVYCLEIQLCSITLDSLRMREIYPKTLNLNAAISDPRTMGIIREEGGKLHMAEGDWDEAYNEFYQAFRNYQEAGNLRARDCLKYVVLASMLALSDINPFAAREAKAFVEDKEIIAMSDLRNSLEANDLTRFEKIIRNKQNRIMEESFLMKYIEPLRRRMREQAILNLIKPFRKVSLGYLAEELSLTIGEIEVITRDLILDQRLHGLINQVDSYIELSNSKTSHEMAQLTLLSQWAESLQKSTQILEGRFI